MPTTLRDLLDLLPRPGRRTHHITCAIAVQLLLIAMIAMHSTIGAVSAVAVLAIIQLVLIHLAAADRHRDLIAGAEVREQALLAELADANTDDLTGLLTRRFIYQHLTATNADIPVTVAFCDADDLKAINTRLSHAAGDDYLLAITERLTTVVIPGDTLVRLGGDEFAIATTQTPDQLTAGLIEALHEPTVIAGERMPVLISVGIFPTTGGDAHTGLGCAEAAMRTAKQHHSGIERYDPDRDGTPLPKGVRPTIRRRDQRPTTPLPGNPDLHLTPRRDGSS
jgi:diguanylate cyclase (GGDEF)-like protein